ncbi:MAG TPA: transglutaminase domain-containing protein, partial [Candidatus Thermoplasmatota archaeon]|nr:transglutaminase domain-containing protein [Candidatus Thermoplasmatota archaeon]
PNLGGLRGQGRGNYVSRPSDPAADWTPDRDSEAGDVVCDFVFNPALGCMKRLVALDAVKPDYRLHVKDPALRPVPTGFSGSASMLRFEGQFPIRLAPGKPTPIFSVSPEAQIGSYETLPRVSLTFWKDGADAYYVKGNYEGTVELTVVMWAPRAYFDGTLPPGATVADVPASLAPSLPPQLAAPASRVAAHVGLAGERSVATIVDRLEAYFSAFGEGPIPTAAQEPDPYLAIALSQNGCCRHRAFAFVVTAQYLGVPTRFVANEAHAFVEVYAPTVGWVQVNLGGCGTYRTNNPLQNRPLFNERNVSDPRIPDGREPPPDDLPPPPPRRERITIPTFTDITQAPESVRKGEPFTVEGFVVVEATGAPVAGAVVDLFLNRTKETPGDKIGQGTTDARGLYAITTSVQSLPARSYQLVAGARPRTINETHQYGESWSDPPLSVVAETRLELSIPAVDGVGVSVSLAGRLLDEFGDPVTEAEVLLRATGGAPPLRAFTDAAGRFEARHAFSSAGTYHVIVEFPGDDFYFASNASTTLRIVNAALDVGETVEAVRGEPVEIRGTVRVGDGPPSSPRAVRVVHGFETADAAGRTTTVTTQPAGNFSSRQVVGANATLGNASVTVLLLEPLLEKSVTVTIRARTNVTLDAPSEVREDAEALVRVVVRDDRGRPLGNASVTLDVLSGGAVVRTFPLITGDDGASNVSVNVSGLVGTLSLSARSRPDGFYLPSESSGRLVVHGIPAPPDETLSAAVAVGVPLAALGAALAVRGRRARGSVLFQAHAPGRSLSIELPDLEADVPPVWEPRVPLRIGVRVRGPDGAPLPGERVLLVVADRRLTLTTEADGRATIEHVFADEGEHPIAARVGEGRAGVVRAVAPLRVSEYRKEAGRSWEALRAELADAGLAIAPDATPRDIQRRLADLQADDESLESAVTSFEIANYSQRPFGRSQWVAFERARARALAHARGKLAPPPDPATGGEKDAASA